MKIKFATNLLICSLISIAVLVVKAPIAMADSTPFTLANELTAPVADGAREPSLSTMTDGRVLMSWTEPQGNSFAVKVGSIGTKTI